MERYQSPPPITEPEPRHTQHASPGILARWQSWAPRIRSLLRIVAAFGFMLHGTAKLFAFPVGRNGGTVDLMSQAGLAGFLEVFGGLFLLFGLFTRPVAFLLSGQMAVAYFQAHAPQGFWPTVNRGEAAMLYCFIWLYFSSAGPGPWSMDALRHRRRGRV